jgi:hypothetical protein
MEPRKMTARATFSIGDIVKPKPEWISDPNNVPSGRILKIESSGDDGAIHVERERRAFAGNVFEKDSKNEIRPMDSGSPRGRD